MRLRVRRVFELKLKNVTDFEDTTGSKKNYMRISKYDVHREIFKKIEIGGMFNL